MCPLSEDASLTACRIAIGPAAELRSLRTRLEGQGARAAAADGAGEHSGPVGQVASGRVDAALGLLEEGATLLKDAVRREVVVFLTRRWAGCAAYLLARDAELAFRVAGTLGGPAAGTVRGVSLAGSAIADLTVDDGPGAQVMARFRRKLAEAGAELVTSLDHPGCIGAMLSPETPVRALLDSSPSGDVLGICCNEAREAPAGLAFVRLGAEAPGMPAIAQAFEAIAAMPEEADRRWLT